uniref:Adenosine deaminase, RNA-specific, B1 n=1 Tax=Mus musculus TaxID=10090 RepID=D6RDS5_MOUSE
MDIEDEENMTTYLEFSSLIIIMGPSFLFQKHASRFQQH